MEELTEQMNNLDEILDRWTNAEEIRLRAGEIDSETMQTVLAITNAMALQVKGTYKQAGIDFMLGEMFCVAHGNSSDSIPKELEIFFKDEHMCDNIT